MYSIKVKIAFILSILAGLLYSSWPLGFLLNYKVAKTSLASGLEAVNQPYNWLFVAMDIASSVIVVIVCYLLWSEHKKSRLSKPISIALLCAILFSLGTIVDALLPERCVPNLMQCPSFTQDHLLLTHGIFSVMASVFLFVPLIISWAYKRKNPVIGFLLVGYVAFGIISLGQAVTPGRNGNWSQDYYITLCSLWLICLPYAINLLGSSAKK